MSQKSRGLWVTRGSSCRRAVAAIQASCEGIIRPAFCCWARSLPQIRHNELRLSRSAGASGGAVGSSRVLGGNLCLPTNRLAQDGLQLIWCGPSGVIQVYLMMLPAQLIATFCDEIMKSGYCWLFRNVRPNVHDLSR